MVSMWEGHCGGSVGVRRPCAIPGVMLPVNRAPQGLVAAVSYKHTSVATSQSYRDGLP